MFYSTDLLTKKRGQLAIVWMAATLGNKNKRLTRRDYCQVNLKNAVDYIISPPEPLALRFSSNLMIGVTRVYQHQYNYYLQDVNQAVMKIRKTFMVIETEKPTDAKYEVITFTDTLAYHDLPTEQMNNPNMTAFGWVAEGDVGPKNEEDLFVPFQEKGRSRVSQQSSDLNQWRDPTLILESKAESSFTNGSLMEMGMPSEDTRPHWDMDHQFAFGEGTLQLEEGFELPELKLNSPAPLQVQNVMKVKRPRKKQKQKHVFDRDTQMLVSELFLPAKDLWFAEYFESEFDTKREKQKLENALQINRKEQKATVEKLEEPQQMESFSIENAVAGGGFQFDEVEQGRDSESFSTKISVPWKSRSVVTKSMEESSRVPSQLLKEMDMSSTRKSHLSAMSTVSEPNTFLSSEFIEATGPAKDDDIIDFFNYLVSTKGNSNEISFNNLMSKDGTRPVVAEAFHHLLTLNSRGMISIKQNCPYDDLIVV